MYPHSLTRLDAPDLPPVPPHCWPLLPITQVRHVGTLRPEDQGQGGAAGGRSQEGVHLSVSHHPEGWRRAAHLGDAPTFTLRRPTGRFLDARAVAGEEALREALLAWGEAGGLCVRRVMTEAWTEDTERGEWCRTLHAQPHEAEAEVRSDAQPGDPRLAALLDGSYRTWPPEVRRARHFPAPVVVPLSGPRLGRCSGVTLARGEDATDALLCALSAALAVDGVWWTPGEGGGLSRGLIRRECVTAWTRQQGAA